MVTWEFPKIRGALFWAPCNKDPTVQGAILGSPTFGNSHLVTRVIREVAILITTSTCNPTVTILSNYGYKKGNDTYNYL